MDVKYIQNKLSDFCKEDWEKFHNLKNLAISLTLNLQSY